MVGRPVARSIRWAAVTATAVFALVLGTAGVANAASGTVNTSGSALHVRSGPGTSWAAWTSVSDGASVSILCQTSGSTVTGTYGTSSLWDMLGDGGFVSDTYVYTGSDSRVAPNCAYSSNPPRANPHGINAAINWEFGHLGSTAYEGLCLHFQAVAYGWSHAGWNTAEQGGDYLVAHSYMHTSGTPPRGALVWYHNSAGTGHVVVSLGSGKIIGTSVNGRVGVAGYQFHSSYRGWSVPYFPSAS